jgi:hypothetical protein
MRTKKKTKNASWRTLPVSESSSRLTVPSQLATKRRMFTPVFFVLIVSTLAASIWWAVREEDPN